jgi:hypothetical protein
MGDLARLGAYTSVRTPFMAFSHMLTGFAN